jgi:heat shock protein HslJ
MNFMTVFGPGFFLVLLCVATGFGQNKTEEWFVADKMVGCAEGASQKCLVVREVKSKEWKYFDGAIRGFRFRDGYTQRIRLRVTPRRNVPAEETPATDYRLLRTVSRSRTDGNTIEEAQRQMQNQTSLMLGGKKWRITEIDGAAVETNQATVEFDAKKKRFGAKICNAMSGNFESNGASLKFSKIIGTMMACQEPLTSTEARFQKAIVKVTRGEQSGDDLVLLAGDSPVMKLTAGSGEDAATAKNLAGGKWTVREIEGEKIAPSDQAPFLQFDQEKMTYAGFSGCNRLMGKYEMNGDALKLGGAAMTRMACLGAERQQLETRMTRSLEMVNRHEIKDGVLRLYEGEKLLLTLAPSEGM